MWPGARAPERITSRTRSPEHRPRGRQQRGVEIALHRVRRSDPAARLGQRHPPVDPDHLRTGLAHQAEEFGGADAEMDPRYAGRRHGGQGAGRVRLGVAGVVRGAQAAGPRIEELHDRGARGDLHLQEGRGDVGEPGAQGVPQSRLAHHQRLRRRVVFAGTAFDQIAGQRERSPGESDQRRLPQLGDQQADRITDVAEVGGIQRLQLVQVLDPTDRSADHRTASGHDVKVDLGRLQRHHDVGVENRGVHAVATDRLQSDLGDEVGPHAAVQHGDALPGGPVLRQ